ncbi:tau-tubulin kinase 1-like isoform X2 [Eriocheir sinensis]|uniref:tau-tubulin kinase 1-like isoform X2 n=1 Tax=Eriocheir sinensis TaxID=95602 RepID=UPI0021C69F47|nr:tau-tubulin kinase 1-like isoform X2 [Eriocheir sinensis]
MNTSTLLSRPFLLVVVLAVSWAAAVPLQDTGLLQDIHSETQLQEFLENNPSVALQMYPDLLREASEVMVVVDPDVVVEMLRRRSLEAADMEEQQQQEQEEEEEEEEPQKGSVEEEEEEEHDRRKRQATFDFGMNRGAYGRNYHASAGYNRRFNNGRTSVGVNAHRNWGSSGKSHGFGISFSHRFRR